MALWFPQESRAAFANMKLLGRHRSPPRYVDDSAIGAFAHDHEEEKTDIASRLPAAVSVIVVQNNGRNPCLVSRRRTCSYQLL
jgi:hypothetical protein